MIKVHINYKKVFIITIIAFLFLPLLYVFGLKDKTVIYGVENTTNLPSLQTSPFRNKDFQKKFEKYWETHFGTRKFMLKTKNTLYDWFNLGLIHAGYNENIIEGKDRYLFGKYLFKSVYKNCWPMPSLDKLKVFYNKAKEKGIEVYFVLAPSKALTYYDNLPDRYKYFLGKDCHIYENLTDAFTKIGIPTYNSQPLINELHAQGNIEPFPVGGIHWNMYGAGMVLKESSRYFKWGDVEMKRIETSDRPYRADDDLSLLQNIFLRKDYDTVFYKPILKKDSRWSDRTIIIGDSYSGQYAILLMNSDFSESGQVIWYENQPLTEADVTKILAAKRIIFVYTDDILDPNHQFYKKLDMLLKGF